MSVAKANLNNELLDVEVWQICDRTGWYWLVLVGTGWYWLVPVGTGWFW